MIPNGRGNLWTSDRTGISLDAQLDQSLLIGHRQSVCQPSVPPSKSLPPRYRLSRQRRNSRFEVLCPFGASKLGPHFLTQRHNNGIYYLKVV